MTRLLKHLEGKTLTAQCGIGVEIKKKDSDLFVYVPSAKIPLEGNEDFFSMKSGEDTPFSEDRIWEFGTGKVTEPVAKEFNDKFSKITTTSSLDGTVFPSANECPSAYYAKKAKAYLGHIILLKAESGDDPDIV